MVEKQSSRKASKAKSAATSKSTAKKTARKTAEKESKSLPLIVILIPVALVLVLAVVSCIACNNSLPGIIGKDNQELQILRLAGTRWTQDIDPAASSDWTWTRLEFDPSVTVNEELEGWLIDETAIPAIGRLHVILRTGDKSLVLTMTQRTDQLTVKYSQSSTAVSEVLTLTDPEGTHIYFLRTP